MPTYADPGLVAQLSQEHSFHVKEDSTVAARFPYAEDVEILTSNISEAGAEAVARRLMPMGQPHGGGWPLTVPELVYHVEIGDTIEVEAPTLWQGARPFFVRGRKLQADRGETVFTLIGGAYRGRPA